MNRIHELNGNGQAHQDAQATPGTKGKGKARGKAADAATGPQGPAKPDRRPKGAVAKENVVYWAHWYTGAAVVLSALLNGWSACHYHLSQPEGQQAGALVIGCAAVVSGLVPLLVWGLGQLAGWLNRAKLRYLAYTAGGVGAGVLLLSVVHVSDSIHLLTGQAMPLAVLLAIGIDCGLVVSEVSAIMASEDK